MVECQVRGDGLVLGPGFHSQIPQSTERAQGLAAEAEGGEGLEVREPGKLRGVMLEGKDTEVVRRNATAIVDDLEPLFAVVFEGDFDAGGAGVKAVLHQFLHGGGEVENHLAGADPVHHALVYRLYCGGIVRSCCCFHLNPKSSI